MKHSNFHIGLEFWCGGKRWRCTDIGSRVIVAISLEPHEAVSVEIGHKDKSKHIERQYMADDPSWLVGSPYGIVEHVFDEGSLQACTGTL